MQSERNLNIAHGREMSRKQLEQYCGDISEDEDENISSKVSSQDGIDIEVPAPAPDTENENGVVEERPVKEQSPEPPALTEDTSPGEKSEQSPETPPKDEEKPLGGESEQ